MTRCQTVSQYSGEDRLDVLRELMVMRRLLCPLELLRLTRLYGEVLLSSSSKASHHKGIYKCSCQVTGVIVTVLEFSFSHQFFNYKLTMTCCSGMAWYWDRCLVIHRKRQIGSVSPSQYSPVQSSAGNSQIRIRMERVCSSCRCSLSPISTKKTSEQLTWLSLESAFQSPG